MARVRQSRRLRLWKRVAAITEPQEQNAAAPGPDFTSEFSPGAAAVPGVPPDPQPDADSAADDVLHLTEEEFEDAVGDALDLIPERLMALVHNVVFLIEDETPPGEPDLLGLYDGIPVTERDAGWGGELPDRITIFRGPTLRYCRSREEVIDEVAVTVVHEIAHYFGIDDDQLHAWGWG